VFGLPPGAVAFGNWKGRTIMFGRRRPSILRTAARTAVVAGTATAVSGRIANRQQQAFARENEASPTPQQAAPPPQARAHTDPDFVTRLQQLADMKTAGVLSDQEFAAAKSKLLGG
jgi:hypothetical protein